jgi:hypothetical protein
MDWRPEAWPVPAALFVPRNSGTRNSGTDPAFREFGDRIRGQNSGTDPAFRAQAGNSGTDPAFRRPRFSGSGDRHRFSRARAVLRRHRTRWGAARTKVGFHAHGYWSWLKPHLQRGCFSSLLLVRASRRLPPAERLHTADPHRACKVLAYRRASRTTPASCQTSQTRSRLVTIAMSTGMASVGPTAGGTPVHLGSSTLQASRSLTRDPGSAPNSLP